MKPNTEIYMAIRNVGKADDDGQIFKGSLKESILWLAQQLREVSMASRIVIGIGRTHEDAIAAFAGPRGARKVLTDDMTALLDSIMGGEEDSEPAAREQIAVEGDDWKGIAR